MTAEYTSARPGSSDLPGRPEAFFLAAGDGERAHLFDSLVTVLLSADETEGQFGVFTFEAPRGPAVPVHLHPAVHEIFFVLDGAVRVYVADGQGERTERRLEVGDFGYVPAGVLHTFKVESEHAKLLGVNTGGFERFFAAAGRPTDARTPPDGLVVPPPEQMAAAARAFGNEFRFDLHLDETPDGA